MLSRRSVLRLHRRVPDTRNALFGCPASQLLSKRHIKGAVNFPLALFDIVYMMTFAKEDKGKKIIVYGGTISKLYDLELADKLLLRGYEQVRILEGGLTAWEEKGYPVEEKVKE